LLYPHFLKIHNSQLQLLRVNELDDGFDVVCGGKDNINGPEKGEKQAAPELKALPP